MKVMHSRPVGTARLKQFSAMGDLPACPSVGQGARARSASGGML